MKKAAIFFADGFEEIEALSVVDVLRRAGMQVTTISIMNKKLINGSHDINVYADEMFDDVNLSEYDAIVLPGGMPGTTNLANHSGVIDTVREFFKQGKLVSAICAAPSVLGKAGILEGKKATVYPGFEDALTGGEYIKNQVVQDDNIITAPGMGKAILFALKIVEYFEDKAAADKLAKDIIF